MQLYQPGHMSSVFLVELTDRARRGLLEEFNCNVCKRETNVINEQRYHSRRVRVVGDKAHLSQDRKGHPKTRPGPGRSTVVFSLVPITSDVQGETVNTATLATGDQPNATAGVSF